MGVQIAGGAGSNSMIYGNTIHDGNTYRSRYYWPGTATGDWSGKQFQTVTQDVSGASGIFYQISGGSFYIYSDDRGHLPRRNVNNIWRLDSDPTNVYFTPSGNGDNAHTDFISIEGVGTNIIIDRNYLYHTTGHAIKAGITGGVPGNILIQNNLVYRKEPNDASLLILGGGNITVRQNIIDSGDTNTTLGTSSLRGIRVFGVGPLTLYLYNNIISGGIYENGNVFSDYNLWKIAPPSQYNEGTNSIVVDDLFDSVFINRSWDDYYLASGSPAIDNGTSVPVFEDIDGTSRPQGSGWDIGAYEYSGSVSCMDGQTRNCPLQQGVCAASYETCTGENWLGCTAVNYGAEYENIETKCSDGLDNDCDNFIDSGDNNCFVDTTPPIISLNSPADEIALNTKEIEFSYNVSDDSLISNCTLFVGSQTRVNYTIENNAVNNFELDNLANGEYYWNISCVDSYGNIGESETWKLVVNYQPSADGGTTGGNGGGSGSGISPKPVAKLINMTNESIEIVGGEEKIVLGEELSFIDIKDGEEAVIVDLYGNSYKISFALGEDGNVLARVLNGDYIIPRGEVLPIGLGREEIYVGIVTSDIGKAKIVMGLNKEKVVGEIGEKVEEDGREEVVGISGWFVVFGVLVLVIIVGVIVWWIVEGRRTG